MDYNFQVNRNEVLRYMGYKGQELSEEFKDRIDFCRELILKESDFRYVSEVHYIEHLEDSVWIKDSNLYLKGADIKKHLFGCSKVLLMAATLGNKVEKIIKLKEFNNLEEAIILDAAATTLIEEFCDFIEEEFLKEIKGENKSITFRYSPGYGDLPIETQRDFLRVLNCERKIGLLVNGSNILTPRKSVTAIIGVYDEKREIKKRSCENCPNYKNCAYRKEGVSCGS